MPNSIRYIDITGKVFGVLTVIGVSEERRADDRKRWIVKCICGNEKVVSGKALREGSIKSCGCLRGTWGEKFKTHGMWRSAIYSVWACMKSRCNNPRHDEYSNYGGRGIVVCERWDSFENFLEDMGEVPKGLTLDRINVDDNYCKENCRWATTKEQGRNKRNSVIIETPNGFMQIDDAADFYGIKKTTLVYRYIKNWGLQDIVTKPYAKRYGEAKR